jgi:hypothetical protein
VRFGGVSGPMEGVVDVVKVDAVKAKYAFEIPNR